MGKVRINQGIYHVTKEGDAYIVMGDESNDDYYTNLYLRLIEYGLNPVRGDKDFADEHFIINEAEFAKEPNTDKNIKGGWQFRNSQRILGYYKDSLDAGAANLTGEVVEAVRAEKEPFVEGVTNKTGQKRAK